MKRGRLMLPALPFGRATPWLLGVVSAAALAYGLIAGVTEVAILGGAGLALTLLAFPLAHVLLGGEEHPDDS